MFHQQNLSLFETNQQVLQVSKSNRSNITRISSLVSVATIKTFNEERFSLRLGLHMHLASVTSYVHNYKQIS